PGPLPPNPGQSLPDVDRIRLSVLTERPLRHVATSDGTECRGGVEPESGFGDGAKLDFSTTFFPLGRAPGPTSVFHLSCEEVFAKAGAEVELCFTRETTAEEEADAMEAVMLEEGAKSSILEVASKTGEAVLASGQGLLKNGASLPVPTDLTIGDALTALEDAIEALQDVEDIGSLSGPIAAVGNAIAADAP